MLVALNELAGRKLAETQARAAANIDRWEALAALTRQLGKQANVEIPLPGQLAADAGEARRTLGSADYLAAVQLEKRYGTAWQELRTTSQECLAAAANEHAAALTTIKGRMEAAKTTRSQRCKAAEQAKSSALTWAGTGQPLLSEIRRCRCARRSRLHWNIRCLMRAR